MRRWRKGLMILIAAATGLWLATSGYVAHRLTSRARPLFDEALPRLQGPIKRLAPPVKGLRLRTVDGEELGAWICEAPTPRVAFLLVHGNGECRTHHTGAHWLLTARGDTVLSLTLRAHGDSTGDSNDFGWSSRHDVMAGVSHLEKVAAGAEIIIVGRSLGAAAALFAAEELGSRVGGYFLEAPYKDLETAIRHRLVHRLGQPLASLAELGLRIWAPVFLPAAPRDISPFEAARYVPAETEVELVVGAEDWRCPIADVRAIASQFGTPATLVPVEGRGHKSLGNADPARYSELLSSFRDRVLDSLDR